MGDRSPTSEMTSRFPSSMALLIMTWSFKPIYKINLSSSCWLLLPPESRRICIENLYSRRSWCARHQNWLIVAKGFRDPYTIINTFLQKGKEGLEVRVLHLILQTLGYPQKCKKLLFDLTAVINWASWLRGNLHDVFEVLDIIENEAFIICGDFN